MANSINTINSSSIKDGEVNTADIAADAVTGAKIADDAVGAEHIEDLDANVKFLDNVNAIFGTGNDLYIYHDGTSSYVSDLGSGDLNLTTNGAKISLKKGTSETLADFTPDGSVDLYYDNEKKIETKTNGAIVQDLTASGAYLDIKGSDGVNGKVYGVSGTTIGFLDDQNHWLVKGVKDGSVDLYYDNSKKLATDSTGITVFGTEDGAAQIHIKADEGDDNPDIWRIIGEPSGPILNFQSYNSGNYTNNLRLTGDAGVELYYNNSVKLATTSAGGTLTGTWSGVGKILQVVTAEHSATTSTTGTSYVDTGLTADITPASSSNKIMVIISQTWHIERSTDQARGGIRLLRDSTVIEEGPNTADGSEGGGFGVSTANGPSAVQTAGRYTLTMVDSPSTTSAITYHTEMANHQSSSSPTFTINKSLGSNGQNGKGYITLLEIAG